MTALLPLGMAIAPEVASAHAIQTNYQLRLDNFEIQATFGDGEAFPDAPVMVYSPENPDEPILVGRTDAEGKFSFRPDQTRQGDWAIEVGDANDNHWDYLVVPVTESGVDLNAISELPQPEHRHDYVAYSYLLIFLAITTVFSWRWFQHTNSTTSH